MRLAPSMRVVLDTNIIVAGLLWQGQVKEIFDLVNEKKISLCLTPNILAEIKRVLLYPKINKRLQKQGLLVEEILVYLVRHGEIFVDIDLIKTVVEDPSDNMFLNCALIGGAEYIVSGDRHLLQERRSGSIPIVSVTEFMSIIRGLK